MAKARVVLSMLLVFTTVTASAQEYAPNGAGAGASSAPADGFGQGFTVGINLHGGSFGRNIKGRASLTSAGFSAKDGSGSVTLMKVGVGALFDLAGLDQVSGAYLFAELAGMQGIGTDNTKSPWQQGVAFGGGYRLPMFNRPSAVEFTLHSTQGVSYISTMFVIDFLTPIAGHVSNDRAFHRR